jgi:hypothetical protein
MADSLSFVELECRKLHLIAPGWSQSSLTGFFSHSIVSIALRHRATESLSRKRNGRREVGSEEEIADQAISDEEQFLSASLWLPEQTEVKPRLEIPKLNHLEPRVNSLLDLVL